MEQSWPTEDSAADPLDEEARAKLSALGYLSSAGGEERPERLNPRSYVQLHNMMLDVHNLVALGACKPCAWARFAPRREARARRGGRRE